MARKIQFKRGLKVNIPKLSQAEIGYTIDEKKLYVGDGNENIRLLDQKDKSEITTQLAEKANKNEVRLKEEKTEPEDLSERALGLLTGTGSVNLLSIPQDDTVTYEKLAGQLESDINDFVSAFTDDNQNWVVE